MDGDLGLVDRVESLGYLMWGFLLILVDFSWCGLFSVLDRFLSWCIAKNIF